MVFLRRFLLPFLFVVALFVVLWARRPDPDAPKSSRVTTVLQGKTMGTSYTVKIVSGGLPEAERETLAKLTQVALAEVDLAMSTYKSTSELSRLNRLPANTPFHASPALREVLVEGRRVHGLSAGAFDVTVGPLVNRWGFGPDGRPQSPPTDEELETLRARVGDAQLKWSGDSVSKARADVYVDLSAIAKGYGVDRVVAAIEARGYAEYMVEVGGEVRVRGRNGNGEVWRIGVERPVGGPGQPLQRVVSLKDTALATSGDYRNYYEQDGRRLSHTIDARTGRPITHRLASVTIVHPRCMTADAFATAISVLGPEAGEALARREDLAALLIVRRPDGTFDERMTPRFKALADGAVP